MDGWFHLRLHPFPNLRQICAFWWSMTIPNLSPNISKVRAMWLITTAIFTLTNWNFGPNWNPGTWTWSVATLLGSVHVLALSISHVKMSRDGEFTWIYRISFPLSQRKLISKPMRWFSIHRDKADKFHVISQDLSWLVPFSVSITIWLVVSTLPL